MCHVKCSWRDGREPATPRFGAGREPISALPCNHARKESGASRKILARHFQEQARCLPGSCTVMTNFVRCKHDSSGSDILPGSCRKKLWSTAGFLAAARFGPVRDVRSVTADKCRIFRGRTVVTQIGLIQDVPGVGVTGSLTVRSNSRE